MLAYIVGPILAFISSIIFIIPFEVILLVLANLDKVPVHIFGMNVDVAKYSTPFPWLLPFVCAVGSNMGSILYYFMGTGAMNISEKLKVKLESFDFDKFNRARDSVVILSSITSIPPVSLVAVAAGVTRLKLSKYFYMSFIGKVVRYFLVLLAGSLAADTLLRWLT